MKTAIQFVQMPVSESLEAYTLKKLESLSNKYDWLIHANVYFKIDPAQKDAGRICEMELSLNGPRIFATSNEKNFELAVKHTIRSLQKQLVKRKSILYHH